MFTGISTYLSHFTKDELLFLLDVFRQSHPRNARKADLLDQAVNFMAGQPVSWMFQLPERDLKLLRKLSFFSQNGQVELDIPEFPSLLMALHLLEGADDNDLGFTVCAHPSLIAMARPFINDVIEDKERMGLFEAERIALGILNIYGVISMTDFAKIIFDLYGLTDNNPLIKEIASTPIIAMQRVEYKGTVYLVSPFVLDHGDIIERRKEFKKIRKYTRPTKEEIMSAGTGAPFCAYGSGKPAHGAIKASLRELGYQEHEIEQLLTDIWINSQFSTESDCAESMFSCVNERIEEIPSFEEYKSIIESIAAYANGSPKWLLKGRTSDDVNQLKLTIRVDEGTAEDNDSPWDDDSLTHTDQLEAFYKNSMAIRHVRPDVPCPCGSGLSYKNCHGKKLS